VIVAAVQAVGSSLHFHDLLVPRSVDCLVFAWLFWIGSAVGSFLNVVAWRMPRGRSINGLSHCPWCANRLAPRDNWPVFGWIALKGRCRNCRLPISPRYPIVELVVGLSLTSLGLAEVYGSLANLPFPKELKGHWHGPLSMPVVNRETIAFWLFHTFAVAGAWAFGLIRFDNHRLPKRLVVWVLGAAIIPMLAWPPFMVVPWQVTTPEDWSAQFHLDAVVRILCSLAAAVFIARGLARFICPSADPKLDPTGPGTGRLMDLIGIIAIPGVIVGWQALFGVTLLATLIAAFLMRRFKHLQRDGLAWFSVSLPVALSAQITFWRELESLPLWPSSQSTPTTILMYALAALTAPWLIRSRVAIPTVDSLDTASPTTDESEGLD
jgi:leader peptidase (prepilin peptidase)/N-methyltransferase